MDILGQIKDIPIWLQILTFAHTRTHITSVYKHMHTRHPWSTFMGPWHIQWCRMTPSKIKLAIYVISFLCREARFCVVSQKLVLKFYSISVGSCFAMQSWITKIIKDNIKKREKGWITAEFVFGPFSVQCC